MAPKAADIALDCSPFLADLVRRHPAWLAALEEQGRLYRNDPPDPARLAGCIAESGLGAGLRIFRNQEMLRITWRELNRHASLRETMADLSRLAEVCLCASVDRHTAAMEEKHGQPRSRDDVHQRLAVIGLGKLGGGELNLSSDVDIVFSFPAGGECDGRRNLSNDRFFTRLCRAVVNSLSEVTEHGFCFRVDTRLRPFGESGPLVCSFGAMEQYYQREGRDWERYALVKARPVAGDLEAGAELLRRLTPFVYRRYIDFGAVEALHEMHAAVREDAANKGRETDVKIGPGGIREIEFLVQAFQLLRGGREPGLQTPSLLTAMEQLEALALLPAESVGELTKHYEFLRRLENAIQAQHDRQTHALPAGEDLARVARVMGFAEPAGLQEALAGVRRGVGRRFNDCFVPLPEAGEESPWSEQWRTLKASGGAGAVRSLERFMARHSRVSLSRRAAQRLDRFMPLLLERLAGREHDADVLRDVFELVLGISRRSAYLALLVQNPPALDRMLGLFGASGWLAETVIRYPALLDELIDPTLGRHLPARAEMDATAGRIVDANPDTETALASLNHMKRACRLRIAVAELETTLAPRQVQSTLTDLAECLLEHCLRLAVRQVQEKHGRLPGPDLGIVGYGTLGAAELGYTSDLDIIFLYERGEQESDGPRPLAPERYHTAMARRLLGLLTATTVSGRLYEVDTRLRPNGRAGLLVSSLPAFERYQAEEAWTWELQALSRARPCAGHPDVLERFRKIRREVLGRPRDRAALREQVRKMRQRIRAEFPSGERFKHGEGGLIDIGFVAQLGVLESARKHPDILQAIGTFEQLGRLGEIGWLPADRACLLRDTHEALTRARHLAGLSRAAAPEVPDTAAAWAICKPFLA